MSWAGVGWGLVGVSILFAMLAWHLRGLGFPIRCLVGLHRWKPVWRWVTNKGLPVRWLDGFRMAGAYAEWRPRGHRCRRCGARRSP